MENAADLQVDTKGHGTGKVFIHAEPMQYFCRAVFFREYCPAKSDNADNMHITRGSCL